MTRFYIYAALAVATLAALGYQWAQLIALDNKLVTLQATHATLDAAHELAKQERERADASANSWRDLFRKAQERQQAERAELERMRAVAEQAAQAASLRADAAQTALDAWRRRAAAPTAECAALLRLPLSACSNLGNNP